MSVYKNYEPGEPTCRLYVKNIAKQVEEKVSACITNTEETTRWFLYAVIRLMFGVWNLQWPLIYLPLYSTIWDL